jgi:superkiller protein 3
LARKYLREAAWLQEKGQREQSIAKYRQAMELNPSMSIKACNAIGYMRVEENDLEGAAEAFRQAIAFQVDTGLEQTAIASVHMNLGILLRRMNQPAEGQKHLAEAVKWFRVDLQRNPNSVVVWDWLGDTLAVMGNFKGASDAFEKAVALEPENAAHYQKLAKALEFQRRYDEAIVAARRLVELLKKQDPKAAAQMSQYVEILEYQRVKQRN